MLAENSEIMKKANTAISVMEMSPRDKWLYDSRMKYEHDRASCINEGYQNGLKQGFADGSYQKAIETANLMKKANCEIDFIIQMTGLSKEEIEKL